MQLERLIDFGSIRFGEPLYLWLLAAPAVGINMRQSADLRDARELVQVEIRRIDAALGPLGDFNRKYASVLARKMVLEELDVGRPRVVQVLSMLGSLPAGVRQGPGIVVPSTGAEDVPIAQRMR